MNIIHAWHAVHACKIRGKKMKHLGHFGIAGEGAYHVCELAGVHSGVLVSAGVLLAVLIVKVMTGQLVE